MSEHVTLAPPVAPAASLPAWLRQQFLDPNERVVWWQGPTETRWQQWCKDYEQPLFLLGLLGMVGFPLLGTVFGGPGFIVGAVLGLGVLVAVSKLGSDVDKHKWHVLTDRRLVVVVGRNKTEEFDLALLRQILASLGSVIGTPTNDQPLDLSKLGQIQTAGGAPAQNVTDLASILAMVKLAQQFQGVRLPDQVAVPAAERPTA